LERAHDHAGARRVQRAADADEEVVVGEAAGVRAVPQRHQLVQLLLSELDVEVAQAKREVLFVKTVATVRVELLEDAAHRRNEFFFMVGVGCKE
jgi:hypothetical protein